MKKMFRFLLLLFLTSSGLISCKMKHERLFVGGFADPGEKGLSVFDFNPRNGDIELISQTDVGPDPSYFCYSPRKKLLYVLNEVMEFNGTPGGGLTTLRYRAEDAGLEKLNEIVVPNGGPCFISISADSSYLFVANYTSGSVAVIKLDVNGIPETVTDTLVFKSDTLKTSHAHMILNDPAGKKVYVTDLGLDRIIVYNFDTATGKLIQAENGLVQLPDGIGPRHFTFNADGSILYVINELGSKMLVFNLKENEEPGLVQILPTVRSSYEGSNSCADIHLSKDGRFLYGSNRGENTIVTYKVEADGTLTIAGHTSCGGDWPRNFVPDPSGKFLLVGNQKSDNVSVFRLNKKTGLPVEPGKNYISISPACLKFIK
jgi:6-phosphogluconolactonase